jgi:hypothetical protein
MKTSDFEDLDQTIEATLAAEPLRPTPPGLYRRIRKRLAVVALIQQEQYRFWHSVAAGVGVLATAAGITLLLMLVFGGPSVLLQNIPGAMGYYDYLKTEVPLAFVPMALMALGLLLVWPFGATVYAAYRSSRKAPGKFDDTIPA